VSAGHSHARSSGSPLESEASATSASSVGPDGQPTESSQLAGTARPTQARGRPRAGTNAGVFQKASRRRRDEAPRSLDITPPALFATPLLMGQKSSRRRWWSRSRSA
jgi:hypothetical protein